MNKNLLALLIIIISASVMYIISSYPKTQTVACTQEALICPGGSVVGRSGPKCEFAPCPTLTKINNPKGFCGGIAGIKCPGGYICQLNGNYPDAGGTCTKTAPNPKATKY